MKKFTFGKALSLTALASAMVLTGCQKEDLMEQQFAAPAQAEQAEPSTSGQVIEGQYIVVFQDGTIGSSDLATASKSQAIMAQSGIAASAVSETYQGKVKGFAAKLSAQQLQELRNNPDVAYIEQDRVLSLGKPTKTTTSTTTNTVTTSSTTGVTSITAMAGETIPWNIAHVGYGDGRGKTVWIIDSGVDTKHPDLTVDVARSRSFVSGITSIEDGFGHGTSVAGIIAAKNNGSGMIGVAAGATIVALRVFNNTGGGTLSSAISAVNHVNNNAKAGDVVNMSIGTAASSTLDNLVKTAAAKGILFAIAAGNSAVDCSNTSPARVNATGIYTISAMDNMGRVWSSSNFGMPVDFAAPGVNVTTTTKGGGIGTGAHGTSFAAPHVAGILLLKGRVTTTKGTVTGDKDSKADPIAVL